MSAGIVAEIAGRRLAEIVPELDAIGRDGLRRAVAAAPDPARSRRRSRHPAPTSSPRSSVARRPPGAIAVGDDAIVRARAYAAGGAAAISVLCEPHWFGGSVDDLRAVRSAVPVPVLAKEFVVDPRQLDLLRAAGADLVLLLAVLHPAKRLARLVAAARDLGLEPLVEAHDARELDAALATGARLIGINNRDLRTLEVDPERAVRLRDAIPGDRLAIAESGVRDPATIARWRATGFDAALVGEALMRAPDPASAARAFVAAGRDPVDLAGIARAPGVKVCGITDAAGILAATRAGADAIGLNFAPGTPRVLSIDEGVELARLARASAAADGARPRIVVVTADLPSDELARVIAAVDPDEVQLSGDEPPSAIAAVGRPVWKALRVGADANPDDVIGRARAYLDAGAGGILLDAAGGPHPGWDRDPRRRRARRRGRPRGPDHPRRWPRSRQRSARRCSRSRPSAWTPLRARKGPATAGVRPRKDPVRVALFVKRARDARRHRPNVAFGPTPVHPGLLQADAPDDGGRSATSAAGTCRRRWSGRCEQLEAAYDAIRHDPRFWAELDDLLARFAGRPTALYRADRLAQAVTLEARRQALAAGRRDPQIPTFRLYLKREDLAHTGAHKINNALGQALLTRRLGKTRVIAETGRRPARRRHRHRLRPARPPVRRVHGRGGHPPPGTQRAPDAGARRRGPVASPRARRRSRTPSTRRCATGSPTSRPPTTCWARPWARTRIPRSSATSSGASVTRPRPSCGPSRDGCRTSRSPASGGGSNAIGLLARFIGEPSVRLAVAEAAGDGMETGRHAAAIAGGTPGILHGSRSLMLQDRDGQVIEAHSASAGLDYPGVGPQLAALAEAGRMEVGTATDREAIAAMKTVTRTEGILPALETSHAVAALPKLLAGLEGSGAPYPDDVGDPGRVLRPRRQGHGRPRAVRRRARRGRGSGERRARVRAHQRHRRRPPDRRGVRPAPGPTAGPR